MEAVPVGERAVYVDDPFQARLLQQARRDSRPVTGGAVDRHRRLVWNLVRLARHVWDVHVHGPWYVARRPLVIITRVHHGQRLCAQDPFGHVFDVDGLERGQRPAARLPGVHPSVERAGDAVETDSVELSLSFAVLAAAAAGQHDRAAAWNEPSDPG